MENLINAPQVTAQTYEVYVPEFGRNVKLRVLPRTMNVIKRIGVTAYLQRNGLALGDIAAPIVATQNMLLSR